MVLRHDKICCTTDKSPFKKEPIEDVCNEKGNRVKNWDEGEIVGKGWTHNVIPTWRIKTIFTIYFIICW